MDGIFFAEGPAIEPGASSEGAHIMDIAPTVLYLMDLPLLDSMDGKILKQVINEDFIEDIDEMYVSKSDVGLEKNLRDNLFKDDIKDKKDRLKGLGYVS
jgi:hypothetical protein